MYKNINWEVRVDNTIFMQVITTVLSYYVLYLCLHVTGNKNNAKELNIWLL